MERYFNIYQILKCLFLFLLISFSVGLRISKERDPVAQEIRLNFGRNDSGNSTGPKNFQTFTKSIPNLSFELELDAGSHIKSACVKSGLWAIFTSPNYRNISAILYASSKPDDQACTNEDEPSNSDVERISSYSQYKSFRFIGNSDLFRPGLSLYKSTFFGSEELYFDGTSLSFATPMEFQSYGFTGNHNWSFYEKPEFQGSLSCLLSSYTESDPNSDDYDAVSYNKDVKITVGSIKRGCESGDITTQMNETNILELRSSTISYLRITSGNLRLPESLQVTTNYTVTGSFTIYSGTNFDGNFICLNASDLPVSDQVLSVGSIKSNGCFPTLPKEIKESRKPKALVPDVLDRTLVAGSGHPSNQIFFISFLIGLAFLLLIIVLGIGLTIYMYVSRKQ